MGEEGEREESWQLIPGATTELQTFRALIFLCFLEAETNISATLAWDGKGQDESLHGS